MWTCGHVDTWTCGHVDTWTREHVDTWTRGHVDTWTRGHVDMWTREHVDMWTREHVDMWTAAAGDGVMSSPPEQPPVLPQASSPFDSSIKDTDVLLFIENSVKNEILTHKDFWSVTSSLRSWLLSHWWFKSTAVFCFWGMLWSQKSNLQRWAGTRARGGETDWTAWGRRGRGD